MSPQSIRTRMFLYIAIAMGTAVNSGIQGLPLSDTTKAWVTFSVGVVMAGAVTARSFIDKSPSDADNKVTITSSTPEP